MAGKSRPCVTILALCIVVVSSLPANHSVNRPQSKQPVDARQACAKTCHELAIETWTALSTLWYEEKIGFLAGTGLWNAANTAEALLNLVEIGWISTDTHP